MDLRGLWRCCKQHGGFEQTCKDRKWLSIAKELGITGISNGGHMCRFVSDLYRGFTTSLPTLQGLSGKSLYAALHGMLRLGLHAV